MDLLLYISSQLHTILIRTIWFLPTLCLFQGLGRPLHPPSLSLLLSSSLNELESSVFLWSEDANPFSEALHICIFPALLIVRGRRRRRRHKVCGVRQSMFTGKHLPAGVITLMGDVTPAKFSLKLPQVQPCLIVLRNRETGINKGMKFQFQEP